MAAARSWRVLIARGCAWLGLALAAAPAAAAATYHDNVVEMPLTAPGFTNVTATYTIEQFSVTPGQDPDGRIFKGLTQTYTGNSGSMSFSVGRQASTGVAKWFADRIAASQNTFNDEPGELNFAFLGTLAITLTGGPLGSNRDVYTIKDVAVAQGSAGGRNNWWFGGKSCKYKSGNIVDCGGKSSAGYEVHFHFLRGGVWSPVQAVNLTSIDYPAYALFPLKPKYAGESGGCVWQDPDVCPPYVFYYTGSQAAAVRLKVKGGLLYNSLDQPFDTSGADDSHSDTPAAIFVMDADGRIYASNANKVYLFHHSTMLAGASVASAGELMVSKGEIKRATNCSGHYQPSTVAFTQLLESLHRQGYTKSFAVAAC